ncbi:MAG TPA: M2 family metallopeptidase [Gammaproteobacteria bacterium]|nr:M2 family metallopeptidase [Gammaproteobacteria bacterium]
MNKLVPLFIIAIVSLGLAACQPDNNPTSQNKDADKPAQTAQQDSQQTTVADARAFIDEVSAHLKQLGQNSSHAAWIANTYIIEDSQYLSAKASEAYLSYLKQAVEESKRFVGMDLPPDVARKLKLLKLGTAMPAPSDPTLLAELTRIVADMEATYGAGKYCPQGPESCRNLGELSDILASPQRHSYDEMLKAWTGWHSISIPMRDEYARFVEITRQGAKELGYANLAIMWKSAYDMPPAEFEQELDRLWTEVKPLYQALHCYVRDELHTEYGNKVPVDGLIPAHLLGNMWSQEWGNIYPLVEPYSDVAPISYGDTLEARKEAKAKELLAALPADATIRDKATALRAADDWIAHQMVGSAEEFYTSLSLAALPESFWDKSMFLRPRDRDVVCHASAWDLSADGDIRIKMCINPTDEDLATIYHELGHLYYYMAYNDQPLLFQNGAHDGFHEAIGDTIVLSMTPSYLAEVGLIEKSADSDKAVINRQMRMALNKVAFLPFARMVDEWRWRVFSGQVTPEEYNTAWWKLRRQYQGISAPGGKRGEKYFDPGAKYHIPANTPYTRYFLARVLQFQFYQAMCDAAGHKGPLYSCSFFGSEKAGKKFEAMMAQGASQPWPQTLELLTGSQHMSAKPLLEYFEPLQKYLAEQNKGKSCGW